MLLPIDQNLYTQIQAYLSLFQLSPAHTTTFVMQSPTSPTNNATSPGAATAITASANRPSTSNRRPVHNDAGSLIWRRYYVEQPKGDHTREGESHHFWDSNELPPKTIVRTNHNIKNKGKGKSITAGRHTAGCSLVSTKARCLALKTARKHKYAFFDRIIYGEEGEMWCDGV